MLVYCLTTHYITDLNCLIHKYVTENNQIVFHKPNTYNSRKVCTNVYMFTDVLMEFLVFFASLFSKIASKFSLPTASNIAIVVVVCNTKSESAVRFHMLYASMVWTRLDFELIIHIHEIVLTNHRKGHR